MIQSRTRPNALALTRWALTAALLAVGVLTVADRPLWAWGAFLLAAVALTLSNRYRAIRLGSASAYAGLMAAFAVWFRDGLCISAAVTCFGLVICDE